MSVPVSVPMSVHMSIHTEIAATVGASAQALLLRGAEQLVRVVYRHLRPLPYTYALHTYGLYSHGAG